MTWRPSHACCLFVYCLFNNTVQVRFLSGTGGADRFFAKAIPFHSMEEQQQRKAMIGGEGCRTAAACF